MKKLIVFAAFTFVALFANAASVVWKYTPTVSVDPVNSAVKLVAWDGPAQSDCQILSLVQGEFYFAAIDSTEVYSVIPTAQNLADLSFTVQLYSFDELDNATLLEESGKVAYADLYKKNAIFFDAATTPNPTAYEFTAAIPEPTSGLLLLLGISALALKRRAL